jgi:hypothetical protein
MNGFEVYYTVVMRYDLREKGFYGSLDDFVAEF